MYEFRPPLSRLTFASAVVSKASAGALEVLVARSSLYVCDHMAKFLGLCRNDGYRVVGTSPGLGPGVLCSRRLVRDRPTVLVLGSESSGLRASVRNVCDEMVRIPSGGAGPGQDPSDAVDSLNVSVAAGVLLYELLRPHGPT